MLPAFVQIILSVCAGTALFLLWRRIARIDRVAGFLTGYSLAARLLLGSLLFWLSYLDRIPRKLNLGGGIWFFAGDADWYMTVARFVAKFGLREVAAQFFIASTTMHQDLLTLFVYLFGGVASAGVLLNAFFSTAAAWVLARWSATSEAARNPARFAIAAVMFYPAGILWSTQPLKDPFVHFLLIAMPGAALLWREAWRGNLDRRWMLGSASLLCIILFGTSGSRWYVGAVILVALAVFLTFVLAQARGRRIAATFASIALFAILAVSFGEGSKENIPPLIRKAYEPSYEPARTSNAKVARTATALVAFPELARTGYSYTPAGTQVQIRHPSRAARWLAGLLAITVPHALIERTGFMHIGGGRGLFWFADFDTLVFDFVIVCALVMLWRARRRIAIDNAVLWLVVLTALGIAVPVLYVITNFGTLFRFRGMIYMLVAMLPLVAANGDAK